MLKQNHKTYKSNGKLLLTGEYVVLDGAVSLAVPTKFGQSLTIETIDDHELVWTSLDENGCIWFSDTFNLNDFKIGSSHAPQNDVSKRLLQILRAAKSFRSEFLNTTSGYNITTRLEFPKNWGLGTSSTLISTIAQWANVDPYQLLKATFGGSGYDIACATSSSSITYQLNIDNTLKTTKTFGKDDERQVKTVNFDPEFKNKLYFVHLNQKQDSRDGIAQYRANASKVFSNISKINVITERMVSCDSLGEFQKLMDEHEQIISETIKLTPIKERLFSDFDGSIKSLGAWGGDFVMVASNINPTSYFESKGYHTIHSFDTMVL